ncbi:MAG: hypothetical protein JWO93_36 [Micrococcaceae bacterium]|jgi:hypothetical protein|nr:hypothetical protein [Micrococcaceae bacterium]
MSTGNDHIDVRALRFAIGFPVLLAALFAVSGLLLRNDVRLGVVLPWGGDALPIGGYLAVAAVLIAVVGTGIGTQAARTRLPAALRRVLLAGATGVALLLTTLFASDLVGQAGRSDTPRVQFDSIVLAMGSGASLALAVVLGFAFKPDEQWTRRDEEALQYELDPDLARDRQAYWLHPRSSVVIMILLAGVFPGALLALLQPWLGLLLPVLAVLILLFLSARVEADRSGVVVRIAGAVPVLRLRALAIEAAAPTVVTAARYGGWGYRRRAGSASYLAASGPAVAVRLSDGGGAVLGAPDAETADNLAALLNRRAGRDPNNGGQRPNL